MTNQNVFVDDDFVAAFEDVIELENLAYDLQDAVFLFGDKAFHKTDTDLRRNRLVQKLTQVHRLVQELTQVR